MARQSVNLPSKCFKSKTEATEYFRKMLNRYNDGEDLNQEDDAILFELLQRHPEAEEKIGIGIKIFYRDKSPIHPTSCFHIERIDGTTTDFSFHSCISGNPLSLSQLFYEACRYAVSKKLISDKNNLFEKSGGIIKCSITGDEIAIDEAEYRHTIPKFRDLVKDFIEVNNISISPEMITHGTDMQYVDRFADSHVENLFKNFHTDRAKLAIFKKNISIKQ